MIISLVFLFVTVDFFCFVIVVRLYVIVEIIIVVIILRILLLVVRKVLECHITILELDRIRSLLLHEKRIKHSAAQFALALISDYDALDVGRVIEIYELVLTLLVALLRCDAVNGTESEIGEHAVSCRHFPILVECLEKHDLVLREVHIRPHLLMETIQRGVSLDLINSCKSLYTRE